VTPGDDRLSYWFQYHLKLHKTSWLLEDKTGKYVSYWRTERTSNQLLILASAEKDGCAI
jgi:hypothetical protein